MAGRHLPYYFSATQSVDNRLGDLFSFIWASYAGLREIWWQTRGFLNQFPSSTLLDVEKKFLSGLPLPGGVDLKRMCLETEWADHEANYVKWLLFEACALYENWLEEVCSEVFSPSKKEVAVKQLQFPVTAGKPDSSGYLLAITEINKNKSKIISQEFFPTLKKARLKTLC